MSKRKSRRKSHTIYLLTINGVPYVGQTGNYRERKKQHLGRLSKGSHYNPLLQSAFDEHGREAVKFVVLEKCHAAQADHIEQAWIRIYDSLNKGFNQVLSISQMASKPCAWNGVEYPSICTAAKVLNITASAMSERLLKGYTCDDDLFRTVKWNGKKYQSMTEAAHELGVSIATMQWRLNAGYESDEELESRNIVKWNGITYRTMTEAAKELGISRQALLFRLRDGHTCDNDLKAPNAKKQKPPSRPARRGAGNLRPAPAGLDVTQCTLRTHVSRVFYHERDGLRNVPSAV